MLTPNQHSQQTHVVFLVLLQVHALNSHTATSLAGLPYTLLCDLWPVITLVYAVDPQRKA